MKIFKFRTYVFFIILLIGMYFRFSNLMNNTTWFGDSSRDILVARHMATYKENFLIRPDANGGLGVVSNTPIYFWVLAIIWYLFHSIDSIIFFFAFVGILVIFFSYKLSSLYDQSLFSLIFPFFISISNFFILISRNVWQPHLLPIMQIISLYFYILGFKQKAYFLWSIQFAFIALHFHLSYFPLLLVTLLLVFFNLIKLKKYIDIFFNLLLITINTIIFVILSGILEEEVSNSLVYTNSFSTFFANTKANFEVLGSSIFINNSYSYYLVLFSILIIFISLQSITNRKNNPKINTEVAKMIFLMLGSAFFLGLYPKVLYFHYLYAYYLIFFLAVSFILANITYYKYFLTSIFIFIFFSLLSINNSEFLNKKSESEIIISRKIAQASISENINYENLQINFCLDDGNNCKNYDSFNSAIWYSIEEQSSLKLGDIANIGNGNNYLPYSSNNKISNIIVVCQYSVKKCLFDLKINESDIKTIYQDNSISAIRITQ